MRVASPLLPNPCHFQDYDRSMLSPTQPGSKRIPPGDVPVLRLRRLLHLITDAHIFGGHPSEPG